MRRAATSLLLLLLLAPAALAAQTDNSRLLRPDARVRVRLLPEPADWTVGRVATIGGDTLVLRDAAVAAIPLSTVERLEVSRGRARMKWTLLGMGAGMVAGIVYSRAVNEDDPADIGGVQGAADGVANTILGMLMGGGAGYILAPERWTPVALPGGR